MQRFGRARQEGINSHVRRLLMQIIIKGIKAQAPLSGITRLMGIADELNRREILTANGGKWHQTTVANLLRRNSTS